MQWLPWQEAAYAAAGAAGATPALARAAGRLARAAAAWTRELAVMFALYGLWQLAGGLSLGQSAGAVQRGRQIITLERRLHLPSEKAVQTAFLGAHGLLRALNLYYVVLHVVVTGVCLIWVFARHRDRYPVVRNTLGLATGASLLVALLPVAPPRLVPGLGVVDVGRVVGPTVYPATARPGLDQLSAMPSVHVAWALVVAGAVVYVLRSPWRWLAVAYPIFTTVVVVITGNHYFADAAVALLMVVPAGLASLRFTKERESADSALQAQDHLAPDLAVGEQPKAFVHFVEGHHPVDHHFHPAVANRIERVSDADGEGVLALDQTPVPVDGETLPVQKL